MGAPSTASVLIWLKTLPRPIGIFACYDRRAQQVLEACDLTAVEYQPDTAAYFDVDGDPAQAATRRPAILSGGRCVKRGLAATRPGRAA